MPSAYPPSPSRLAEFELVRRLGAGGMAEVFLAKKRGAEGTYKVLVVKRILPQHVEFESFRSMFAAEARLATRLNHPNIVQVYDFQDAGEEGQLLSMEYVEGPDLGKLARALRQAEERLPPYVAAYIAGEVARGLHYAHERVDDRGQPLEIVHRDVSPQNILLSLDGAVKVADFGIASASVFLEEPGVLKGKITYMSPEQARGEKVDRRSDIFSLGVVLHELLTARPAYPRAEDDEQLLAAVRLGRVEAPSARVSGVPPEVEAIVMRALSVDPDGRFQTARELAAAIARALLDKRVLVDADVLGGIVAKHGSPRQSAPGSESPARGAVASRSELTPGAKGTAPVDVSHSLGYPRPRDRPGREVRHVALVALRLGDLAATARDVGPARANQRLEQLKAMLGEVAFKYGAAWTWEPSETGDGVAPARARAVVGLMSNSAGAATSAARLAVDVHDAVVGADDGSGISLVAHVGIARGIAAGERDAAGILVRPELQGPGTRLADLLADQAPPQQTWVAGGLYRLARRDFVWQALPNFEFELPEWSRLPRHMHAYRLQRPLSPEEKSQQHSQVLRELIGRDAELAHLHAAYHQSVQQQDGAGRVVSRVIVGEMGIGKTALANAFVNELPPDARVLRVECSAGRRELPFFNAGQWVRELTGVSLDQALPEAEALVERVLGDALAGGNWSEIITRLAELATGRLSRADDEADLARHRRLLATGIRRAFTRLAQQAPLVVVLDGTHWADVQSLELVSSLIRRSDALPILTLLITRPDDPVASVIEGVVTIELNGLSRESQLRLVQEHLGVVDGVEEVCAKLIPRAAGNPFFLLEMVDALLERGAVEFADDSVGRSRLQAVAGMGDGLKSLPSTLGQLIADRLHELPPEEHRVVAWLAVAGGELTAADFAALVGPEGEEAVARLCARGLCDARSGAVCLRHPLTRDVAYLGLAPDDRRKMHGALGQRLAQAPNSRGVGAACVGRHFARADRLEQASQFYLEAAREARFSYQLKLAESYYTRAKALLPGARAGRLVALQELETICRIQGRWGDRRAHLSELRQLARESQLPLWGAAALIRSARFSLDSGRLTRALHLAQKGELVARQVGSTSLEVESQSLMADMLRDLGDMQGALSACDRALESVSRDGSATRLRAEVLRSRGALLLRVGRVEEAVQAHAEAVAVFRKSGARRLEARAKTSLAVDMFVLGRFEDAIALSREAIRLDLTNDGVFQIARTFSTVGQCYFRLGHMERAKNYMRRARQAHQRYGDQDGRADTLLASAEILIETGDFEQAEAFIADGAALSTATGNAYDSVHEKLLRALISRKQGEPHNAVIHAFDARQVAEAQAYVAFHFYAMAIEACARVDSGEQHTGILLATTAMGAIETIQGSEYGLETRLLCCEALATAGSPQAASLQQRAALYARELADRIVDPELKACFLARLPLRGLLVGSSSRGGSSRLAAGFAESASPAATAPPGPFSPQGQLELAHKGGGEEPVSSAPLPPEAGAG